MTKTFIVGVGMVPFTKPAQSECYTVMGGKAVRAALADAGLEYKQIQRAFAGYIFGDSGYGQEVLYPLGTTGIPIVNVNNACASGSTAVMLCRETIAAGAADVALAVGFEQMFAGPINASPYMDRPLCSKLKETTDRIQGWDQEQAIATQTFGGAGNELMEKYGFKLETFAKVSVKSRAHAARNPYAVFRDPTTVEEVLAAKHIFGPLTRTQCSPPTCGAAAAIVASEKFVREHGLQNQAVEIVGQALTTDPAASFATSMVDAVGATMARNAAQQAFEKAGLGPNDVDVVELHDCFTSNELISYQALGLCGDGEAEKLIEDGATTYGGKWVVNPSGGLISKGHPIGASGVAQMVELCWHLRGLAESRQVENARVGLQHNVGLGGACVVTLLRR